MYQSHQSPIPLPSANPWAFEFYWKILVKFPGMLTVSMVKCIQASASKRVKSPTHQRLFKNFSMCQTVYSNVKSYQTQPKYPKYGKAVLRRFVHFNKIVHSRKPKFTAFFKGSWMFQQNSECRSNNRWKQRICWMGKELRIPFACDADQRIDTGESQFPTVKNNAPVKCPGYSWWEWGILELTGTFLG